MTMCMLLQLVPYTTEQSQSTLSILELAGMNQSLCTHAALEEHPWSFQRHAVGREYSAHPLEQYMKQQPHKCAVHTAVVCRPRPLTRTWLYAAPPQVSRLLLTPFAQHTKRNNHAKDHEGSNKQWSLISLPHTCPVGGVACKDGMKESHFPSDTPHTTYMPHS